MLLIDELDRTDEPFEAYLLEVLAEYQVTIPELGAIKAASPPIVIITSNRTREIHDAIKRRCLYHWVDFPNAERELAIVRRKVPGADARLSREVVAFTQRLRAMDLFKSPGIAETLDWAEALVALDRMSLDPETVADTLGALLKYQDDIGAITPQIAAQLVADARSEAERRSRPAFDHGADRQLFGRAHLAENILHFARVLRKAGLPVGPAKVIAALEAVEAVGVDKREDFRAALESVLIERHEQQVLFDQAFELFWRNPQSARAHAAIAAAENLRSRSARGGRSAAAIASRRGDGASTARTIDRGARSKRSISTRR